MQPKVFTIGSVANARIHPSSSSLVSNGPCGFVLYSNVTITLKTNILIYKKAILSRKSFEVHNFIKSLY